MIHGAQNFLLAFLPSALMHRGFYPDRPFNTIYPAHTLLSSLLLGDPQISTFVGDDRPDLGRLSNLFGSFCLTHIAQPRNR